ncbi:DUF4139 domain-containing protein [Algiphilus sp.]|uniref:DUF4139 domain-containing protein n=1 Tax=Algiphilus sp. TaxID=1872431 RepID=UPI0032EDC338
MHRSLTLAVLALLSLPGAASVVAVHLGPQGAEVTREIMVAPGEVTVEGLPATLDVAQLRVTPSSGIQLRSMAVRARLDEAAADDQRRELQAALHEVEDRLALLEREAEDRALTRSLLGRVGSGEQGVADVKTTVMQVRDALYRIAQEEREARAARRSAEEERARLQLAIKRLGQGASHRQTLVLDVAEGAGLLRLRYPVDQAHFEVHYRLQLDSASQRVRLEPRLLVRQNTGTDWRNVRLTASSTRPSYRLQVPDPRVPVLRPRPEAPAAALRMRSEAMAKMADAADAAGAAQGGALPAADVQAQRYDIRLDVPGRVDVPSDNQQRPFMLPAVALDADVHARIVPQQEAAAYVIAEWTMPAEQALIAGPAEVLRDAVIIGRSRLPQLLPGQSHRQGFGIDPALEVDIERAPLQRDESFFGGTQRWVRAQTVRVRSAHGETVPLRMIDSVPVAGDSAIRVELSGDPPSERNIEDREGVHRWDHSLEGGATHRWHTQVTISAPADMKLDL